MFLFIISLLFLIIGVAWLILAPPAKTVRDGYSGEKTIPSLKPFSAAFFLVAIVLLILSLFTVVGTRNTGVPTVFGKPTGETYSSGLHFKAPWVKVTDIDSTIQPEEYNGDNCIYVKIGDGGSSCISIAYRWRINPEGADQVFSDYRNSDLDITDAVRKALVSTNIKAAINEELGNYNPLDGADLTADMTPEELANAKINVVPDYEAINAAIQKNVNAKIATLGDLIDIQSVTVSYVKLPEATQNRIDAFNAAVQDTKIALQEVATKNAQASGNEVLAKSLQDPNVLVSKCLDGLANGDFTAPPGFSCWPNSGSAVVLPATR